MKFRISPAAFFQVNTPACEVLYTVIREVAAVDAVKRPVIYGVCVYVHTVRLMRILLYFHPVICCLLLLLFVVVQTYAVVQAQLVSFCLRYI